MEPNKTYPNIKLASRKDKAIIHKIIIDSFSHDEGFKWMLKATKNPKKLEALIDYIIDESFNKGFIYINDDHCGISIWQTQKKEPFSINIITRSLKLLVSLKLVTLLRLIRFESLSHKQFPATGEFVYLMNLAVLPNNRGKGYASELMNPILDHYKSQNISAFLETSNFDNISLYKKKGFNLDKTVHFDSASFYFMST